MRLPKVLKNILESKLEIWSREKYEWEEWNKQLRPEKVWREEIIAWKFFRWVEGIHHGVTAILLGLVLIFVVFPILGLILLIMSYPFRWLVDYLFN